MNIKKLLKKRVAYKKIVRPAKRVTVEVHQRKMGMQKMERDRSRFFR